MQAWENFLTTQEVELGVETVHKWLKPLKIIYFDACNLHLEAKDSFQALWFEEHIRPKIQTKFLNNNSKRIKIHLSVANNFESKLSKNKSKKNQSPTLPQFSLTFAALFPNKAINLRFNVDFADIGIVF